MIRVSNFFQVDAITIRKDDLKAQEFNLSVRIFIYEIEENIILFLLDFIGIDSIEE